jgi:medium-chain acyl-[acyl-carrier-protein] hydrolase
MDEVIGRVQRHPRPEGKKFLAWGSGEYDTRLFCFPQIGGSASSFRALSERLDPSIEPWALRLPGRENQIHSAPIGEWSALLDYVEEDVIRLASTPYILLGNCAGSLVAFALCHRLMYTQNPPRCLIVCGHLGPDADTSAKARQLANLSSADLWAEVAALGWTPPEVMEIPALRAMLEPGIRADCVALGGYEAAREPDTQILETPIAVIGGARAEGTQGRSYAGWRGRTTGWYMEIELPGDTWLLRNPLLAHAVNDVVTFVSHRTLRANEG